MTSQNRASPVMSLVRRSSLEDVSPAETVRRLSTSITDYNGTGLSDDATLLLVTFHGANP